MFIVNCTIKQTDYIEVTKQLVQNWFFILKRFVSIWMNYDYHYDNYHPHNGQCSTAHPLVLNQFLLKTGVPYTGVLH